MARPKKTVNTQPIRGRIEQEFWRLMKKQLLAQITISELVKNTHCNRTTFYYYFDNVDDLAWKVIAESIPVELPKIARSYFTGEVGDVTIDADTMHMVKKLSTLIGRDGSSRLAYLAADALKNMWLKELVPAGIQTDDEISYMLDFTASGVIGIISRYGRSSDVDQLENSILLINKLFSQASMEFIGLKQLKIE